MRKNRHRVWPGAAPAIAGLALALLPLAGRPATASEAPNAPVLSRTVLPAPAFPIAIRPDRRGYQDARGRPFVGILDTVWLGISRLTLDEFTEFVQIRRSQGYTGILVSLVDFERTRSMRGTEERPFPGSRGDADLTQPNQAYFDEARKKILAAREAGLWVGVVPAWYGWQGDAWRSNWGSDPGDTSIAETYGAYLASRFGDLDHVFWLHGGDNGPTLAENQAAGSEVRIDLTKITDAHARAIKAGAKVPQMHTYHTHRGAHARSCFPDASWMDMNAAYAAENVPAETEVEWARGDKPVMLTEGYYENRALVGLKDHHLNRQQVRGTWWHAITTGALAAANGNEIVWAVRDLHGSNVWNQPETGVHSPVASDMTLLSRVLASYPDKHWLADAGSPLVASNRGTGTSLASGLLSTDRNAAIVYFPSPRDFTLDTGELPVGATGLWVNPQTGETRARSSLSDSLSTPEGWSDSVLMIGGPG